MYSKHLLACAVFVLGTAGLGRADPYTGPVFPANNIWNTPVDTLPVSPNSAAYVNTIGATHGLHPDFGSGMWDGGPIGIPYTTVPGTQPKVPVSFYYPGESDPGPYPIPSNPPIEGGPQSDGDRHILIIDRDNKLLYELYDVHVRETGRWSAGSGAIFDLNGNALRPAGWTSADAAGLPIFPGLVRYEEVAAGEIRHAIRFTAPETQQAYVWPARHHASSLTGTRYPPMGQRFRLKASFDIRGFSSDVQVILRAMKKYGIILADNGSAWYISGAPDPRWNDDVLHELDNVTGSAFEAVDCSSLMVHPDSAEVRPGIVTPPAPSQVTATRGTYLDRVLVTWQPPAGALDCALWRGPTAAAAGATLLAGKITAAAYTDTNVFPGLTYFYSLSARFAAATSAVSYSVAGYITAPQATEQDFDGDGISDEALYDNTNGRWKIRLSASVGSPLETSFGGSGFVSAPADYNGDGRVDMSVYYKANGNWHVRQRYGLVDTMQTVAANCIPVPGDYDGDGKADLATYLPSTGRWTLYPSTASPPLTGNQFALGGPGQQAAPGDYDGDGRTDAAVYDPASGNWIIHCSTGGTAVLHWGGGTKTVAVPDDYDGDGRTDLGIFYRSSGNWLIQLSSTGTSLVQAGNPRTVLQPAPGDYDGDTKADIAVYVPARSAWYERRSSDGIIAGPIIWGGPGFAPVSPWR